MPLREPIIRPIRRSATLGLVTLAMLCSSLSGERASAQEQAQVDVRRLRVAVTGADLLAVRTTNTGDQDWHFGALVGYIRDPLQIVDTSRASRPVHGIVNQQLMLDLIASHRFGDGLAVGVHLPLMPLASGSGGIAGAAAAEGLSLGDPAVALKWRLVGNGKDGFGLAVEPVVTLPLASARSYAGDSFLTVVPRLIADWRAGATTLAANVGARIRPSVDLGPYSTGSELVAALLVRQDVLNGDVALLGEVGYETALSNLGGGNGQSLEAQAGVGVCVGRKAMVTAAAGGGLLRGLGSTSLRVLAGVRFGECGRAPIVVVPPPAPKPAPEPEPEPEPEPPPPSDRDKDGIIDAKDACPDVPGPPSEIPARNGCPPPKIVRKQVVIAQHIQFAVDSDRLLEKWRPVLDDVAALLVKHPELTAIEVQGHTDNTHTPQHNLELSQRRSEAVVRYLVGKGVVAKRLTARGFGLTRPIASNDDEAGRQANRRVEFHILRRADDAPEVSK